MTFIFYFYLLWSCMGPKKKGHVLNTAQHRTENDVSDIHFNSSYQGFWVGSGYFKLCKMRVNSHIHTLARTTILFKVGQAPLPYYAGSSQTPAIVYRAPMGPYYQ